MQSLYPSAMNNTRRLHATQKCLSQFARFYLGLLSHFLLGIFLGLGLDLGQGSPSRRSNPQRRSEERLEFITLGDSPSANKPIRSHALAAKAETCLRCIKELRD
ncbi:hypothetical protein J3459_010168 [Metarhizium acridum]|uniref:uncharacterized protein n=1 Tax=Metarhizium acridum TaxID=92637 RepID=UPI001C6D28F3|nr:hypothetical protein J3459_018533 [Metarhizium acridum]KAG8422660.1 hypothetical protein J3459_010168 [Metarhizium acridum]KAG8424886.1 hypothetical protein J3458_001641 [Metarhizium acridum]